MDLRHYDSNGLELSLVLLFEVGLISIVIKKLIAVAMTISYSIATDALLFTHICPFIYYPNVKSKRVCLFADRIYEIHRNKICKKRYFQALIFTFHLQRHINWVIFVPTMEKFEKVRPQSRAYMVIEYSLHIFTPPPLIVIVKRVCQQGKKVAFMHICIYTYNKKK